MPNLDSMFSLFHAHCATLPNQDNFRSAPVQTYVKDEMAFAPTPNPYSGIQKAAERLQSGKSIFFDDPEEAKEILAAAKHA